MSRALTSSGRRDGAGLTGGSGLLTTWFVSGAIVGVVAISEVGGTSEEDVGCASAESFSVGVLTAVEVSDELLLDSVETGGTVGIVVSGSGGTEVEGTDGRVVDGAGGRVCSDDGADGADVGTGGTGSALPGSVRGG